MHDLKTNFGIFRDLCKSFLQPYLNKHDNFKNYRHHPKMCDLDIIALSLCQEAMSIDSENFFWSKLKNDYNKDFPDLIHLTRYNTRKKNLAEFTHRCNQRLAEDLSSGENIFLIDSIPIPVCKNARANRLKVCCENFESSPDKGYSAINRQYYTGYKLHLVTSIEGVSVSYDITKASVHDIHFLNDVKYSGLNNATLIGDGAYISSECKIDLFETCKITLAAPAKKSQLNQPIFPFTFKKSRKRIETLFSQLCDQMMLKRNYAKTFLGLSIRILSKITAVTALQMINRNSGRPLNRLKHALAT